MGVLPGAGSIGDRMSAARVELANLEQQIAAANGALNSMRGQLAATPQSLPGIGDGGGTASGQLAQLEGQINQNLARGWTESHPDIVYARASRSRACGPMPQAERAQRHRRHAQPELRLAARDDGRARGASSPPRPRAATSSSPISPSSPRASRPSPASPPSRAGSPATMTC